MKNIIALILSCFFSLSVCAQRPDYLKKDSIKSSMDGNTQVIYFDKANGQSLQPLVVELHSWSFSADTYNPLLTPQAHSKNWNYILPNFRGVNNHPKACCSEFVISDIDEAIDWALKNMPVDRKRIYIIGTSGGGYATLAMYMKSRHKIASFASWVPLTDLNSWYAESLDRKNKYASEIINCLGTSGKFDSDNAKERSPLFWKTPKKKSSLQIYAGIHDGNTGPIPISHSINMYNKLLADKKVKDQSRYVSENDANEMLAKQTFKTQNPSLKIDDRLIHYQNSSKNIGITIFEGGHEMLRNVALDLIEHGN